MGLRTWLGLTRPKTKRTRPSVHVTRPATPPKRPTVVVTLDDKGIPVSDYGTLRGRNVGAQRSIVAVADKGLDYWNRAHPEESPVLLAYSWTPGRDLRTAGSSPPTVDPLEGTLNCADWLVDTFERHGRYGVWRYAYASYYGTQPGWRCAHAHGQAIRLLLRAHDATGRATYLDDARLALAAFEVAIEDGGFAERLAVDQVWYHKLADAGAQKAYILNGMMFGLLGVLDADRRDLSPAARRIFREGMNAVCSRLARYDDGAWSFHDDFRKPTSMHYHDIHCRQLRTLLAVHPDSAASEILDRWSQADVAAATAGRYERKALGQ